MTTSSPVSLEEAKAHLRVEHCDDDSLIEGYLVAGAQWFERETGAPIADPAPQIVKQCVLLLVGHWYEHREAVTDQRLSSVPLAVESIVAQFAMPEAI